MDAQRNPGGNTSENLKAILDRLQSPNTIRIRLFATTREADGMSDNDGPDTNLPLLHALVQSIPQEGTPEYEIFDGIFLTAARRPRYLEVKKLLDVAIESRIPVEYGLRPTPFTSSMEPAEAVILMLDQPVRLLDERTRPEFFSLLSGLPEERMN